MSGKRAHRDDDTVSCTLHMGNDRAAALKSTGKIDCQRPLPQLERAIYEARALDQAAGIRDQNVDAPQSAPGSRCTQLDFGFFREIGTHCQSMAAGGFDRRDNRLRPLSLDR